MKIVMMGSGGVGGYYGARLQQAGHQVTFVARGAHAETMRGSGLRIRSELGDAELRVKVVDDPARAGPADLVVVAVKLWDTEETARAVARVPGVVAVSLQNGVDKDEILAAAIGRERVLGGVTHIGAVIAEPGTIAHTGRLQRVTSASWTGRGRRGYRRPSRPSDRRAWRAFSAKTSAAPPGRSSCSSTAFSGMTALTRKPIGEVRAHPATREMLLDALREGPPSPAPKARGSTRSSPGSSWRRSTRSPRTCSPRWRRI